MGSPPQSAPRRGLLNLPRACIVGPRRRRKNQH